MSEDASIITCRKCGSELDPTWATCKSCGAPTSSTGLVCPNRNCQRPIEGHWKVCAYCATKLSGSETPYTNEVSSDTETDLSGSDGIVTQRKNGRITIVPLDLPEGEALWDKYRIVKKLGKGGFGAVYQVEDTVLNEQIALKVVVAGEGNVEHATEEIVHEFKLRSKVTDISHIINAQDPRTCKYKGLSLVLLPMDLADGGNLRQWLLHNQDVEKRLKAGLEFFKQACLGIKAIHDADLVHLDIKPENILLVGGKAKIADFGIGRYCSKMFAKNPKQLLRRGVGTPEYMSPEQFRAARPKDIGRASDIYSLGIVLFEILDGNRPFEGDPLELQDAHLNIQPPLLTGKTETWWSIVKRCLEKEATERYSNIDRLLKDLDRAAEGLAISVDVSCRNPKCGHTNILPDMINIKQCEICKRTLPESFFSPCPGCGKVLRCDIESCKFCGKNVAAHNLLLAKKEKIEQLKDESPVEAIELLNEITDYFSKKGDEINYRDRAIKLLNDLEGKHLQLSPLITQAQEAELDHLPDQAIEAWQEVLKIISRHRIAKGKIQELKSRIKDFGEDRKKAVKLMNEAKFEDAEELLESCQKLIRDYENIDEILKICRQRAKEYDEAFKGARKSLEQNLFRDAHEQIQAALIQAPESLEAKGLSEQIDRAWATSLIQEAPPKIKAAKFEDAEALLDHAEQLCPVTEELDKTRELLRDTRSAYDEHMGCARKAERDKDFDTALEKVDLAIDVDVCPDSEEAKELKKSIKKQKKDREEWRTKFRENVIATARWLFVLIPGIAGVVILLLYTKLEIGGIAIGIGILAGILNCIRKTRIYNVLSNWNFIKGKAKPVILFIGFLLVMSGVLAMVGKPLAGLVFPIIAAVYPFGKKLKELVAIVVKGPVIRECRTKVDKTTHWLKHLTSKSKYPYILIGVLLVVIVGAAITTGIYQSKQSRKLLADISNAATAQVAGNWKEAAILYEKLLEKKPDNLSFEKSLAVCKYMIGAEDAEGKGKIEDALVHYHNARNLAAIPAIIGVIDAKIKSINQKMVKIKSLLAEIQKFKDKGQFAKSLEGITEILTLDSGHAEAKQLHVEFTSLIEQRFRNYMTDAANYEAQGNWQKAIEIYNQAIMVKPNDTDVKDKLAECYHNLNLSKAKEAESKDQLSKARDYYTKALSYKKDLSTQTDLNAAKEKLAKLNELLICAKANDNKENCNIALNALEELLKLEPNHADAKQLYEKMLTNYVSTDPAWWINKAKMAAASIDDTIKNSIDIKEKDMLYTGIAAIQAKYGDINEAMSTILCISETDMRPLVIAAIQAEVGNIAEAKAATAAISESSDMYLNAKSSIYCNIAKVQAKMEDLAAVKETFRQAKAVADKIEYDGRKFSAYEGIVRAQVEAGDIEGAEAIALGVTNEESKSAIYAAIAETQVKIGDITGAKATVKHVKKNDSWTYIYGRIVHSQVKAGNITDAKATVANIDDNSRKTKAYLDIIEAQAMAGDFSEAKSTVENLDYYCDRVTACTLIVKAQVKKNSLAAAQETLSLAKGIAKDTASIKNHHSYHDCVAHAYTDIAEAQAWMQDISGAKATVASIDNERANYAYGKIAEVQAETGDIAGAKTTISNIPNGIPKEDAYIAIARAQLKVEDFSGALDTALAAVHIDYKMVAISCSRKLEIFDIIVHALVKTNTPEKVSLWVESLKNDEKRAQAYQFIAERLFKKRHAKTESENRQKEIERYQKAAEAGDGDAMYHLAGIYEKGKNVAMDYHKAMDWYEKAAEAGNSMAMCRVGTMYAKSFNDEKAWGWYRKAAKLGNSGAMLGLGKMYKEGNGVPKDHKKAVEWYSKASEIGNSEAMLELGEIYTFGLGSIAKDYKKAIDWYRKAAEAGSSKAIHKLGINYRFGMYGVAVDYKKAMEWFRKGAKAGAGDSMNQLGIMYQEGLGVAKNNKKAMEWYRKAANIGHDHGMFHLGQMYAFGYGVKIDYAEAVKWYRKSADAGNSSAMGSLGWMYDIGHGVTRDETKAVEYYLKGAKGGDANSMFHLGVKYKHGDVVTKDYKKAMEWFRKAAKKGESEAMVKIGLMYCEAKGVIKDYKKAIEWFHKAAEKGNPRGMTSLATIYHNGLGVTKNYTKAVEWLRKAAEAGDSDAMTNLGLLYVNGGRGVVKDDKKMLEWFRKAARLGNKDAKRHLTNLGEKW